MTTAPIMYEPQDEDLPLIAVTPELWERLAMTLGARVELDPAGDVVVFNDRAYCMAVSS